MTSSCQQKQARWPDSHGMKVWLVVSPCEVRAAHACVLTRSDRNSRLQRSEEKFLLICGKLWFDETRPKLPKTFFEAAVADILMSLSHVGSPGAHARMFVLASAVCYSRVLDISVCMSQAPEVQSEGWHRAFIHLPWDSWSMSQHVQFCCHG